MAILNLLQAIVGVDAVLTGDAAAPYLTDWRRMVTGQALAVVRPGSTAEVSQVMKCCAQHGVAVVPQGGNTGQVAGATPDDSGAAIVLQLGRMNRVREIDAANDTMVVEAGCILQQVQDAARAEGRLFPLSLGAEGSCCIGGNLASNAGGTQVLSYGNARDLALGLEVVLPNGEIWDGLRKLRKDNTGYSLRDLFIGSEGTLGVITAATLKLFPLPAAEHTAFVAVSDIDTALALFQQARRSFHFTLTGFEVISAACLEHVVSVFPQQRSPLVMDAAAGWYVLMEVAEYESETGVATQLEDFFAAIWEEGLILDAAIAVSDAQRQAFWALRESITLALAAQGYCVKHDISLPISAIPAFVRENSALLEQAFPEARLMAFGHLGDGNLHYNVLLTSEAALAARSALETGIQECVHEHVVRLGGSISAEQGIGGKRVRDLEKYKSPLELSLMRAIKQAIDPQGLMNPGKLLK